MAVLPAEIPTGLITGQYYFVNSDNVDDDTDPDLTIVDGVVKFTASAKVLRMPTKKASVIPLQFKAKFNSEGLVVPLDGNGIGLELPATDSALINPLNYTWLVEFELRDAATGFTINLPSYPISVPEGVETDLTLAMPVDSSPGVLTVQGPSNILSIGTVTTGAAGSSAFATLTGSSPSQVLDLTIPEGDKGDTGTGIPAGGSALQLVRKNSGNTATEWVSPDKSLVGLGNVDNTSDVNKPVSTAQQTALDAKVAKGELVYNALDYGVKGDNTTDDTAAMNAAAAAVYAINPEAVLYFPPRNYKITDTVTIRCGLKADAATFNYTGTGTALVIGSATAGTVTFRRDFKLPRIIKTGRVSGWDGTSVGVKAYNLNDCTLTVPFIQDFEYGLYLMGNVAGFAYTKIFLGSLWENHKNLVLDNTSDGYCNQNTFHGGRLQQSLTKGAVADDVNASQIYMIGLNPEGGPNNNTFLGTSIEGPNVAYYRVDIAGSYNAFYNCRWEASGGNPRVRYRATALSNVIHKGYNAFNIEETFDGTLGGGEIRDSVGAYTSAGNTSGQVIPNNVWTAINTWAAPVQRRVSYNSSTGEFTPRPGRWAITATVCYAVNATGRRISRINVAGSVGDLCEVPGNANRNTMRLSLIRAFDGTQTFKIETFQTSGTDLALETTAPYVRVQAEYLGG